MNTPHDGRCDWCDTPITAFNCNGVRKRYCGRYCKGRFETAAVRLVRVLLGEGRISPQELRATRATAAVSVTQPTWILENGSTATG